MDLIAILKYIYTGEVQIPESQLTSFVRAIVILQMKGLVTHSPSVEETSQPQRQEDEEIYAHQSQQTFEGQNDQLLPALPAQQAHTATRQEDDVSLILPVQDQVQPSPEFEVETVDASKEFFSYSEIDAFFGLQDDSVDSEDIYETLSSETTFTDSSIPITGFCEIPHNEESQASMHVSSSASSSYHPRPQLKRPAHFEPFQMNSDPILTVSCKFCERVLDEGPESKLLAKRKKHENYYPVCNC